MRRVKKDIYTITPTITTNPIIYTDTNTIIITNPTTINTITTSTTTTRIHLSKTHQRARRLWNTVSHLQQ